MITQVYSKPDIYRISIPLPGNPLRILNSYVIKTPHENLLIDTGFNQPECLAALRIGINKLNLDLLRTSLFFTHCHSDHIGLVNYISNKDTRIYMSGEEKVCLDGLFSGRHWTLMEQRMLSEGLDHALLETQRTVNPARAYAPAEMFNCIPVSDGETIRIGVHEVQFISTPGHTPGHMCLYMPKENILFSGDHILFDITPNITFWSGVEDSLDNYLESLKKVKDLDLQIVLPGHRGNDLDVYERIDQIQEHHRKRLEQTLDVVRGEPGLNAYQIGARLTWKMRGKNWEEFPIQQKWFALGETIAHLDYLKKRNLIMRLNGQDGSVVYTDI